MLGAQSQKRESMATIAESVPSGTVHRRALYALLGGIFFFIVAVPAPDLVSGGIPYLIEGRYTFLTQSRNTPMM
jgi:hypothetical protein